MRTHLTNQPLLLCGKPMKNVMQYTYFRKEPHELGVAASAEATINKRYGKVKQLIFEIKSILEDCRLNTVGGASTGLDLWEKSVVLFLYFSSECWVELKKESLKKLKELHLLFYRCLLGCPSTTPSASLFWFLGQLLPENKVMERKLLFLFHVANLPIQTVARQIYEEQRKLEIGGLVSECRNFLAQINVRESLLKTASKSQWRSIIRSGILKKNRSEVLEMCKGLKKIDYFQLKDEEFELKEFFKKLSLKQSRTLFAIKTNMLNAKMNYMSDPRFSSEMWKCVECNQQCTTEHLKRCIKYERLRTNMDWSNDEKVIDYFQKVIKSREEVYDKTIPQLLYSQS